MARELVVGALDSAIQRERFRQLVWRPTSGTDQPSPDHPAAQFRSCPSEPHPFPDSAAEVLQATLMAELAGSHGSAFFISPDGLVLTAAHVIHGTTGPIRLRDSTGAEYLADVVRVHKKADSALLHVRDLAPGTATPCLSLDLAPKTVGSEAFAIGAPASKELAFSITKGVVSGVRYLDHGSFIQTDASVNPGNSGGPLLSGNGQAIGLVSWKVAATAMEGIGFAVPIEVALARLGLQPSAGATATELLRGGPAQPAKRPTVAVRDAPDPAPSLDPRGDAHRARVAAQARRKREREEKLAAITPAYIPVMRWGGGVVAAGGFSMIFYSATTLDDVPTREHYEDKRLINDLGWILTGLGATSTVLSFILAPSLEDAERASAPGIQVTAGPTGLSVSGAF